MDTVPTSSPPSRTPPPPQKRSAFKALVAVLIVLAIIIAFVAWTSKPANGPQETSPTPVPPAPGPTPVSPPPAAPSAYRDGVYTVFGEYRSPGGDERIEVTVTLADDRIAEAVVVSLAERPMSKRMQGMFISGFRELVVGKRIDEVQLSAVSGSSLTPKGFNNALTLIKAQAS